MTMTKTNSPSQRFATDENGVRYVKVGRVADATVTTIAVSLVQKNGKTYWPKSTATFEVADAQGRTMPSLLEWAGAWKVAGVRHPTQKAAVEAILAGTEPTNPHIAAVTTAIDAALADNKANMPRPPVDTAAEAEAVTTVRKARKPRVKKTLSNEGGATVLTVAEAKPRSRKPSTALLRKWMNEGGCEALDGCWVEPDGTCEHGQPAWLRHLGMI